MQNTKQTSLKPKENVQTSLPQVSPVKTSRLRNRKLRESLEAEVHYSSRSSKLFAYIDHDTWCLKTPQCSLVEDLEKYSSSLPKSGMMRNGKLYRSVRLVSRTREKGASSLPTLLKSDGIRACRFSIQALTNSANKHLSEKSTWTINLAEYIVIRYQKKLSVSFCAVMQGFPQNWFSPISKPTEML